MELTSGHTVAAELLGEEGATRNDLLHGFDSFPVDAVSFVEASYLVVGHTVDFETSGTHNVARYLVDGVA